MFLLFLEVRNKLQYNFIDLKIRNTFLTDQIDTFPIYHTMYFSDIQKCF